MIQIDGLSQPELHAAIRQGNMPFLKRLCTREGYVIHSHYSGLPSNTPGVQGELFYGVKGCVPGFSFKDSRCGEVAVMYSPSSAAAVERKLSAQGEPLLKGGSAYSDVFAGGAQEAHFCAAKPGWSGIRHAAHPLILPFLVLLYLDVFAWIAALIVWEFGLAVAACLQGVATGKAILQELQFVLARLGPVILLRELVVRGAQIDIARGLPVIHLNLMGYDDHAHRRGPRSSFARWPLRGIDAAIARIWHAAHRAQRRDYDVWLYSDHGQEMTTPYEEIFKIPFSEAVQRLGNGPSSVIADYSNEQEYLYRCAPARKSKSAASTNGQAPLLIVAMGPLGHLYPAQPMSPEQLGCLGEAIAKTACMPAVIESGASPALRAWTAERTLELPRDARILFGEEHPFRDELTEDLMRLCRHPDAGALILFGWRAGSIPLSFPVEQGAHAGFGPEETHAFALLPKDAPLPRRQRVYLRPLDLRKAALRHLGRSAGTEKASAAAVAADDLQRASLHGLGRQGLAAAHCARHRAV